MIPRYSNPEMIKIWSDFNKYDIWFKIEIEACKAMEKLGNVPLGTAEKILAKKNFAWNPARIDEIEAVTKHDVIAFRAYKFRCFRHLSWNAIEGIWGINFKAN